MLLEKHKKLNTNIFNIDNLEMFIHTDCFLIKFGEFAELQKIIFDRHLELPQKRFFKGTLIYKPEKFSTINNYIFSRGIVDNILPYSALYRKTMKKIIGHIILEKKYDELISHMEENILKEL